MKIGFHDEVGAAPWAIVKDGDGVEHYARLRAGSPLSTAGRTVLLKPLENGLAALVTGRGADMSR